MVITERIYVQPTPQSIDCLLGADIGGTNSNFGIFFHDGKKLLLLLSLHIKSKEITNFTDAVVQVVAYLNQRYQIRLTRACFAVAGVISPDQMCAKPTNLPFMVDAQDIIKHTSITCAFLVNDFEVIGYGIDLIDPKNVVQVHQGKSFDRANKGIIGAGTGLGKCILDWNKYAGRYIPVASEGGHADMAAQTALELDLIKFIQDTEQFSCNVSWEDVLSGRGIQRIYAFFRCRNNHIKGDPAFLQQGPPPDEIFKNRNRDKHSWDTYELYSALYARCAKNFTLDALALNGLYIAGGIAAHNLDLFKTKSFLQEFINCGKQAHLLKNVSLFVITDYNVSLYGAADYMIREIMCV